MSGHSHAKTIRRKKEAGDKQRGQIFSKMARLISVAAREGGSNPETNTKLRMAIEEARSYNLPKDNIERAIKRGAGEISGEKLEEILYEAYGPKGVALIIEGITDNKNRALGEIKQILSQHNGRLVQEGAVKWLFERKGCITLNLESQDGKLKSREKLGLLAIESGAQDFYWHNGDLDVYTEVENLDKVKKALEEKGAKVETASLDWKPKEMIELEEKEKECCLRLFEALDENDSVQDIYSNLKI